MCLCYLTSVSRNIDKVDATMADIQEQTQLANEVSEAISSTTYVGVEIDDVRRTISIPWLGVADHTHRTNWSRNLQISSRKSSTRGSRERSTSQYTIQQGRLLRVRLPSFVILCLPWHLFHSLEPAQVEELDEEAELKKLQEALAM
jgi:hypothetical protein